MPGEQIDTPPVSIEPLTPELPVEAAMEQEVSPPAGEPQAVETAEAEPQQHAEGMDLFGEQTPDALRAFEGGPKFTMKPEELSQLPAPVRHMMHEVRSAFLQKTKALATEKQDFEQQVTDAKAELAAASEEIQKGRAKLLEIFGDERLKQFATVPEEPEGGVPEPWTPEGMDYRLKAGMAERMNEFFEAFNARSEEEKTALESSRAERAHQARVGELSAFIEAHPDFEQLKPQIVEARKEMGNNPLYTAEKAYFEIKNKMFATQSTQNATALAQAQSKSRSVAGRPSQIGRGNAPAIPDNDAKGKPLQGAELARWYQNNPDSHAEARKRWRR